MVRTYTVKKGDWALDVNMNQVGLWSKLIQIHIHMSFSGCLSFLIRKTCILSRLIWIYKRIALDSNPSKQVKLTWIVIQIYLDYYLG